MKDVPRQRWRAWLALAAFHGMMPIAHAGDDPPQPPKASQGEQPAALDMSFGQGDAPAAVSPAGANTASEAKATRVTLAQEEAYKVAQPDRWVKNRSSVRLEYSKHLLEHYFVQFDGKHTQFLDKDHRHDPEGSDTRVSQAYVQASFHQTSIGLGIQTVAWGESILAPITDEVSPRDNRELFNFNLEELRLGQPMVTVDQYTDVGRFSAFYTPRPRFNKNPERGSAYFVDPFNGTVPTVRSADAQKARPEFGLNWRKSFGSADVSVMAARLTDNDYALHMDDAGRLVQEAPRYSLAGMTFSYATGKFLFKTEAGWKSPKSFNDAQLQIVRRNEIDTYLGVEYKHSGTLSLSLEGVNQHIAGWDAAIQTPRDRQSFLFSATKTLMNDDLTIQWLQFFNRPDTSTLTMLLTTYKWNDNLTFGLNAIYPSTRNPRSGLWNVRDQKQLAFKIQYQF